MSSFPADISVDSSKPEGVTVKDKPGKSKRRSNTLPQFDEEPILLDSDSDEDLPTFGAYINSGGNVICYIQ